MLYPYYIVTTCYNLPARQDPQPLRARDFRCGASGRTGPAGATGAGADSSARATRRRRVLTKTIHGELGIMVNNGWLIMVDY
jgi:hypothetical protein